MGFLDAENESLLSKYMRDLKRWPVLSPEESVKLFQEMEDGSSSARRKIINSNLRLVISVAKGYATKGISMDDIIQEGNIGLMRAVERFDWKKGYRFSTYAIWWIRQAIGQHLTKNKRIVRMPAHIVGLCKKMKAAMEEDESMTLNDLSNATGASTRLVKAANDANGSIVSLDAPRKSGSSSGGEFEQRWIDVLADASLGANPAECISEKQLVQIVRKVMDEQLSPKESVVLRLRYGLTDDPADVTSYPLTETNFGEDYEAEEETDLFDGDGPGWDGVQEDYGDSGSEGVEDELLLGEELALEGDAEDGQGTELGDGS
jgi:RNA polymerase sigma factor (sigma-70 family)